MSDEPATGRQAPPSAITKVVAVVEALAHEHGISQVARRTGMATSTVHRILQELVDLGWVRVDDEHEYLLGARLLSLAGQAVDGPTLARIAHPILRQLSEDSGGHATHFAVRSGHEAVYVDKVEGRRAYQMRSRVGLGIPLHTTAIGKALLATLPEGEVRAILARTGMPTMTPRTITDIDGMLGHLEAVRRQGYAMDSEENEAHIRCVGAAVTDHRGTPIGGISVSGLAFEMDQMRIERLAELVKRAAGDLTRELGGTADQATQGAGSTAPPAPDAVGRPRRRSPVLAPRGRTARR
jgi:IclR family transcriptional regulator, acetate operon repressor